MFQYMCQDDDIPVNNLGKKNQFLTKKNIS